MKSLTRSALVAATVTLLSNSTVFSAEHCDAVVMKVGAHDRDLVSLDHRSVLTKSNQSEQRLNALNLGYIVPLTSYPSGVFIVKTRHTIVTTGSSSPIGGNTIRVERQRYVSPCSGNRVNAFGDDVQPERYIDYHFYGLRDSNPDPERNLERAHADVGQRPIPTFGWLTTRTGCLDTRYSTIRAQFLYGDQYERRIAGTYETLTRQSTLFSGSVGPTSSFAAPSQYRQYDMMKTEVIPYRRLPNTPACFAFSILVPSNAVQTEVMIVDADDAFANSIDPQQSWLFTWPAPKIEGHLSRHH